eukprot:scaffold137313_cov57-Attheya_sp.AAC.1
MYAPNAGECPTGAKQSAIGDIIVHVMPGVNSECKRPQHSDNSHQKQDQVIYKVGSFESFVSGPAAKSGSLSISNLLQEQDMTNKKHVKLLEAELARSSHQVKILEEFLATNSGAAAAHSTGLGKFEEELSQLSVIADDNLEDSDESNESDIYFGNTQAY